MADGQVPGQGVQRGLVEDLGNEAHVLVDVDPLAVAGCYASRLLTAVLQCIQPVVGEFCYFFTGCPDPEDAACVLRAFFAWEKIMRKFSIAACHWSIISRCALRLFRRPVYDLTPFSGGPLRPPVVGVRCGFDDGVLGAADAPAVQDQGDGPAPTMTPPAAQRTMKKPKTEERSKLSPRAGRRR